MVDWLGVTCALLTSFSGAKEELLWPCSLEDKR